MKHFITVFFLFFCCTNALPQGRLKGTYDSERQLFIPADTSVQMAVMHEGRAAFVKDGKVGFIDSTGRIAVPAVYNLYMPFKNGAAMLMNPKRKYGMVDAEGRTVLPFGYDYFNFTSSERFFIIYGNGHAGLVDSRGNVRIATDRYNMFYQPAPAFIEKCVFKERDTNPYLITAGYSRAFQLDKYIGVLKDSLWGYADTTGREVIAPTYKSISLFRFGMACVSRGTGKMMIDSAGNILFRTAYDTLVPLSVSVVAYAEHGKTGALSASGDVILPAAYDAVSLSDNNTLLLRTAKGRGIASLSGNIIIDTKYNGIDAVPHGYVVYYFENGFQRFMLLDSAGKQVSGTLGSIHRNFKEYGILSDNSTSGWIYNGQKKSFENYDFIWPLLNTAFAYREGELVGLISADGSQKLPAIYESAELVSVNSPYGSKVSTLIRVKKGGKYGLLSGDLKVLLPPEYDAINNITKSLAGIKKGDKYGFINMAGKWVTPLKYDWAMGGYTIHEYKNKRVEDPLLQVGIGGLYGYIDSTGNEVTEIKYEYSYGSAWGNYFLKAGGKSGMIDSTGKEVIPFTYDQLDFFVHFKDMVLARKDGKYGVINTGGNIIIPLAYDKIESDHYYDSSFIVYQNGKAGVMDHSGKQILPLVYDYIELSDRGFWLLVQNKKTGFYATAAGKLFAPEYDEAVIATDNLLLVRKGELWGMANDSNHLVYPITYRSAHAYSNATELFDAAGKRIYVDHEPYIRSSRRAYTVRETALFHFLRD